MLLTAAVLKGGRQVYRARLQLPAATGQSFTYSYAEEKNVTASTRTENSNPVAYLWLPAHVASPFRITVNGQSLSREAIAIQANHDNGVDLRKGDAEAVLYKAGETPGTDDGTPYGTFHDALEAAAREDRSRLWLQRNVLLSGETKHDHTVDAGIFTQLHLNGYILTGDNCTLDASAAGAALQISDTDRGTGRITGTFRIKGNIYIGSDIISGNIGVVLRGDGTDTQLYRLLARVQGGAAPLPDGVASWTLGGLSGSCYVKDRLACLWLPVGVQPETLALVAGGTTYLATGVQIGNSHTNSTTLREPAVVAMIGQTGYTSLATAFAAAATDETIVLQQSTTLAGTVALAANTRIRLDLQEFALTMQGASGFTAPMGSRLTVESSKERGVVTGNFSIEGEVLIEGSVSLSGLVTEGVETVYRTCFFLPDASTSGSWRYASQRGTLLFTGKANATGQAVAFGWLRTEVGTSDLVTELDGPLTKTLADVMIQSNHNNRFNMEAGKSVAQVGSLYFTTFAAALDEVNAQGGGTISLIASQTLRGMNAAASPVVVDLSGCALSMTADAAFETTGGGSLRITDASGQADKGYLYGNMSLTGDIYIDAGVKLSGTVVRKGEAVFRLLIDGLGTDAALTKTSYTYLAGKQSAGVLLMDGTACLWLPVVEREEDVQFSVGGETYEATLLPLSLGHNNHIRAYRRTDVIADAIWADGANRDCNVVLAPGVKLTIESGGQLKTLYRVTMGNGSEIICRERVLVAGGIVYRRTFASAKQWEAFSLPYEARRVTAVVNGEISLLAPNLASGTGGHYWLQALADDGSFRHVAEERLEANKGYLIAMPEELTTTADQQMAVSFASAPNQFLAREVVETLPPVGEGYRQAATGVLYSLPLTRPFYLLNAAGTEFIRQQASLANPIAVAPFSCYLLAGEETLAAHSSLRLAGMPVGNETIRPVSGTLTILSGKGCIRVLAGTPSVLRVYTVDGRLYRLCSLAAGETTVSLPRGLYLVDRQKIYVTE